MRFTTDFDRGPVLLAVRVQPRERRATRRDGWSDAGDGRNIVRDLSAQEGHSTRRENPVLEHRDVSRHYRDVRRLRHSRSTGVLVSSVSARCFAHVLRAALPGRRPANFGAASGHEWGATRRCTSCISGPGVVHLAPRRNDRRATGSPERHRAHDEPAGSATRQRGLGGLRRTTRI